MTDNDNSDEQKQTKQKKTYVRNGFNDTIKAYLRANGSVPVG